MPLSRLSNQSRRTGALKPKRHSRRSAADEAKNRHDRLWDAIRSTRKSIDEWKTQSEHVQSLFNHWILPRERRFTDATCELSEALIDELSTPDRSQAERSLIGLWIIQNIESLCAHPFAKESRWHDVLDSFTDCLDANNAIDSQLIRLCQQSISRFKEDTSHDEQLSTGSAQHDPFGFMSDTDDEHYDEDDVVFDFGWHKREESDSTTTSGKDKKPEENAKKRKDSDDSAFYEENSEALDKKINSLEQRLSIDKLFRQLAKVLHPDREQDESLKAAKHKLMSECLEARQSGDIDTLLQLYCEHVGELPDELTEDSHGELIKALEKQLKQLQAEFRQLRFSDPLLNQIIDRYSDSSQHRTEQRVMEHAAILDKEIAKIQSTLKSLSTDAGFEEALATRRAIELDRLAINELTGNYP